MGEIYLVSDKFRSKHLIACRKSVSLVVYDGSQENAGAENGIINFCHFQWQSLSNNHTSKRLIIRQSVSVGVKNIGGFVSIA